MTRIAVVAARRPARVARVAVSLWRSAIGLVDVVCRDLVVVSSSEFGRRSRIAGDVYVHLNRPRPPPAAMCNVVYTCPGLAARALHSGLTRALSTHDPRGNSWLAERRSRSRSPHTWVARQHRPSRPNDKNVAHPPFFTKQPAVPARVSSAKKKKNWRPDRRRELIIVGG